MPSIDDVFAGSTLRASDIKGKNPVVTIQSVAPKQFKEKDGTEKMKLEITFVGAKKTMICNVTNAKRIAHLHGNDYTLWGGKKIALHADMVDVGGEVKDGIRVYPAGDNTEPNKKPPMDDMNGDSIPF